MNNLMKLLLLSTLILIFLIIILLIIPKTRALVEKELISYFNYYLGPPLLTLISILIILLIFILLQNITLDIQKHTDIRNTKTEKEIFSFSLNNEPTTNTNNITKSFSLGITNSDTESYYCFFIKENNKYKLKKENAKTTYIEKTNNITPKILYDEKKEFLIVTYNPTKIGEKLGLKKEKRENITSKNIEKTIYIPEESVIQNCNSNSN